MTHQEVGRGKRASMDQKQTHIRSKQAKPSRGGVKKKRRALTLVEMLIVITLIGIIASALAVNLGGGLRKGQEFKTQQGKKKIQNILYYEMTQNMRDPQEVVNDWEQIVADSPLRDRDVPVEELIKDGYGQPYEVFYDEERGDIRVRSSRDEGFSSS